MMRDDGRRATGDGRTASARMKGAAAAAVTAVLVLSIFEIASAQRPNRRFGMEGYFNDPNGFYTPPDFHGNHPYDGRFTFVRIKYRGYAHFTQQGPGWSHDYPRSDTHLMSIVREITAMRPFVREGNIFGGSIYAFDEPEVFKYPVAYVSEPGGWSPTPAEIAGFRNYIKKGGFVIFDDFSDSDQGLWNLVQIIQEALPKEKVLPLPKTHQIFDSFFKIDVDNIPWGAGTTYGRPQFYALFENNDPTKRVLAVINHNMDIGEAWEYSDEGFMPVPMSNEAYKLGVNYLIYALTH